MTSGFPSGLYFKQPIYKAGPARECGCRSALMTERGTLTETVFSCKIRRRSTVLFVHLDGMTRVT